LVAPGGLYQQGLQPPGAAAASGPKVYQLLRVRVDAEDGLVPEISGHRLMVSIRFMRPDAEGRLRPAGSDCRFELSLCA
jgi:cell division protein ZapD